MGIHVVALTPPVQAVDTTLKQRILPLDCVFEIVNDGSNSIVYITPEACGVVVDPHVPNPDPTDPSPTPTPTSPASPVVTIVQTGTRTVYQIPLIIGKKPYTGAPANVTSLPFQPIAVVEGAQLENPPTAQQEVVDTVPGLLAVITIAAVIIVSILLLL